jgi:hypothetical protein
VGWVRPDGTGDVVPETPTIDTAQLAADLERLGELTDAELAAAMDEAPVSDGEPRAR